jgi:hypothetical protein
MELYMIVTFQYKYFSDPLATLTLVFPNWFLWQKEKKNRFGLSEITGFLFGCMLGNLFHIQQFQKTI